MFIILMMMTVFHTVRLRDRSKRLFLFFPRATLSRSFSVARQFLSDEIFGGDDDGRMKQQRGGAWCMVDRKQKTEHHNYQ